MYATNRGTHVLPHAMNGSERNAQDGLYTSASIDQGTSELILELVNVTSAARKVRVDVKGAGPLRGDGRLIVLGSADLKAENSLEQPTRLVPVERTVPPLSSGFDLTLDPQSFTVLRAKYAR
jgi:alpha-L-arabinofuranosidase